MTKFSINLFITGIVWAIAVSGSNSNTKAFLSSFIVAGLLIVTDLLRIFSMYRYPDNHIDSYYSQQPEPTKSFYQFRTELTRGAIAFIILSVGIVIFYYSCLIKLV